MLFHQKPTHVGKEEAPIDIVRVGIRVRPFVVASMVPGPFDDVILEGHTIHRHQNGLQRRFGLIAFVGPKSMGPCGDADPADHPKEHGPGNRGPSGAGEQLEEANGGTRLKDHVKGDIPPNNCRFEFGLEKKRIGF